MAAYYTHRQTGRMVDEELDGAISTAMEGSETGSDTPQEVQIRREVLESGLVEREAKPVP